MNISVSAFAPKNLVSLDGFGSPVTRQPAHLRTHAESGAYLRDSSPVRRWRPFIYLKPPYTIGVVRVYRVPQLCTDGVHCREFAGTGPVNLKVVPNECCLGRSPCVCVCVLSSHLFWTSELWTYQPGSHRRKVTQGFSTFLLRCLPQLLWREGFGRSFPSSTVKSNFVFK